MVALCGTSMGKVHESEECPESCKIPTIELLIPQSYKLLRQKGMVPMRVTVFAFVALAIITFTPENKTYAQDDASAVRSFTGAPSLPAAAPTPAPASANEIREAHRLTPGEAPALDAEQTCGKRFPLTDATDAVARAECLNAAARQSNGYAVNPDLCEIAESLRLSLARRVQNGEVTVEEAERQFNGSVKRLNETARERALQRIAIMRAAMPRPQMLLCSPDLAGGGSLCISP